MFIVFGIRESDVTISQGEFFCRHCDTHRPYRVCQPRAYFTLFFLPVWKYSERQPYAMCEVCGSRYSEEEVTRTEDEVRGTLQPWVCADCGLQNAFTSAGCLNCGRRRPDLEGL